jgi:DNA transformation protein
VTAALAAMRNLGEKSAGLLAEVGIHSPRQLAELGAVEAYARVKAARPREVSLIMLWALYGALNDMHFAAIPPEVKDMLKDMLRQRQA